MKQRELLVPILAIAVVATTLAVWGVQPVSQVVASYAGATACDDLVTNGGFETSGDWVIGSTPFPADYTTVAAHSGSRSMRLGVPPEYADRYSYSSVYQKITIPAGASSASLSFWYKPYTEDSSGDLQQAILYDTNWDQLKTIMQVLSNSGQWTQVTVDVAAYAGQTVYLYFNVYNDGVYWYNTWMYVDDVVLDWCGDVTPTATTTATSTPPEGVVCDDELDNGGFETTGYWGRSPVDSTPPGPVYTTVMAHSGSRSMLLGIPPGYTVTESYSSIYQAVTVPSGITEATLTFWYKPYTEELVGDKQVVSLLSGPPPATTLASIMIEHSDSRVWTERTFDMTGYEGQTVYLYFSVYNDADYLGTWMYVDDVSVEACRAATPTPTSTPTNTPTPTETPVPTTPTPELAFDPSHQTVFTHTAPYSFTSNVVISDVEDLAAYQFDVLYDPSVVEVVDMTVGDFLGSTGRDVLSDGASAGSGRWRFWASSGGSEPLPDGAGVLATTFLSPVALGQTDLSFENVELATLVDGEPVGMTFGLSQGQIEVGCFGDANGDGKVDVLDLLVMTSRLYCQQGDACYNALYDVDGDGEIRASDVIQVAAHWGPCGSVSGSGASAKAVTATSSIVHIDPGEATVCAGQVFTVAVKISQATDLGSFQFDLRYDPQLLQVGQVTLGNFLGSTGRNVLPNPPVADIDNETGIVKFDAMTLPGGPNGPSGAGDLAHVWLSLRSVGEATLELEAVELWDADLNQQEPGSVLGARVTSLGLYMPLVVK